MERYLIGSAKLHEIEPWAFLTDVTTRLAQPGDLPSDDDLTPLLPDRWIAANPRARRPVSREPREQPVDRILRRRQFSNAYMMAIDIICRSPEAHHGCAQWWWDRVHPLGRSNNGQTCLEFQVATDLGRTVRHFGRPIELPISRQR